MDWPLILSLAPLKEVAGSADNLELHGLEMMLLSDMDLTS